MMTADTALEELLVTDPMLREVNQGLMVTWINADLLNRANHDVRKSVVLYDEDKMFVAAMPAVMGPVPNPGLSAKLYEVGVRFYSRGIV